MKDFDEIHSQISIIDRIDSQKNTHERARAIGTLAGNIVDELIAGRPVPGFCNAESITRIEGLIPEIAYRLVEYNRMAVDHRTHLIEKLYAEGGRHGKEAASILRHMNAAAQPYFRVDTLDVTDDDTDDEIRKLLWGESFDGPETRDEDMIRDDVGDRPDLGLKCAYDAGYDAAFKEIADLMVANGACDEWRAEQPNDIAFVRGQCR